MPSRRIAAFLLVIALGAHAQDGPDGDEEAGGELETGTEIEIGGTGDAPIEIEIDPFAEVHEPVEEPNRPPPAKVGEWTPPALDDRARATRDALLAERGRLPDDAAIRYRLADFYLEHGWIPHAESEYLSAARLDPDSIRPWEGLLRVYAWEPGWVEGGLEIALPPGIPPALARRLLEENRVRQEDWLSSDLERARRITRAYEEIVRRRPDDVARRRELIEHLKRWHDHERVAHHARLVLERMPDDADTRYELAEALRLQAAARERLEEGAGGEAMAEAVAVLRENVRRAPDHVPSLLRLARMLSVREGHDAREEVTALESRAFFHLFVRPGLAPVPFRDDTFRLARACATPRLANRLWDDAMQPPGWREADPWDRERRFYDRWIHIYFPNSGPRTQLEAVETLARRGDPAALGILLALLWHAGDEGVYAVQRVEARRDHARMVAAAVDAVARMRGIAYVACERFARTADTALRRRRAVRLLRAVGDPRAVGPLVDALAWDPPGDEPGFGVAAALEALGEPRAVDALARTALDPQRPLALRREAVEALAAFPDPRSVEALGRLRDEDGLRLVVDYGLARVAGDEPARARLRERLVTGGEAEEVLRLLAKAELPGARELLLDALDQAPGSVRPLVLERLRAAHWPDARERVRAVLLARARSPSRDAFTIRALGEIGGEGVPELLQLLLEGASDWEWYQTVAQAFANTGDERAVRYFNRMRILEKDEQRRLLAKALHNLAVRRHAARDE